jgi:hypothetical protein
MSKEDGQALPPNLSAGDRKNARRVLDLRARVDAQQESSRGGAGGAWEIYRLELGDVVRGLSAAFPELPGLIEQAVKAAHARGRKAVMSDIFGDGNGAQLGADKTVTLALTGRDDAPEGHVTVAGNAFDNKTQGRYFKALDASPGDLVFVMFNPWGGTAFGSEPMQDVVAYSAVKLFQLFKNVYSRLASPGVMYVQLAALHQTQREAFLKHLDEAKITYTQGSFTGGVVVTKGGFPKF